MRNNEISNDQKTGEVRIRDVMVFMAALFAAVVCGTQTPQIINCQGRLVNGTSLVNGPVGLSLRLFNVPSGGSSSMKTPTL